jgi:cytoskeletal protein CcmA (bactofilin family)
MTAHFSIVVLVVFTATVFLLPLLPSLIELCRKSDVLPLNVVPEYAGEIGYFAHSFRTYIHAIQPALKQCGATGSTATGIMPDGAEYLVLGRGEDALVLRLRGPDGSCPVVLASSTTLLLPPDITFSRDIYANSRFLSGRNNQFRAVLGEEEVHLSSGSRVLRWIHAGGDFVADSECQLLGRVSSDRSIRLESQCRFVRLHAPRIEIGASVGDMRIDVPPERTAHLAVERVLHHGDLVIPAGKTFHGDLVVRGELRICVGARIYGSIKCEKDLFLEPAVVVGGSVITERKMRVGARCLLHGPVIAERSLFLASRTRCGSPESETTVSAPRIAVEEGVLIFGTLWAREQGRVVAR